MLREFLAEASPVRALVLTGGPGIGKTTLWEAGIDGARERGLVVLLARPSGAEARLSFAALIDLFDGVDIGSLPGVPAPQRSALEVALLRAEPTGVPRSRRRSRSASSMRCARSPPGEPLLVAIDDAQWLDPPSADALAFAAHRLEDEPVEFLLARRPGRRSALEQALERSALERLEVGPLSLGATRRLLSERLGLSLPRQVLRRVVDSTLGNPLFALEVGRALLEHGPPSSARTSRCRARVEQLLGTRVALLPDPVRRVLLAVALSGDLRMGELEAIAGPTAVEDALDAGLLLVEADRVRASHPLLAAAARKRSRRRERRELHLAAGARRSPTTSCAPATSRLATDRPDAALADTVAAAAAGASARGAAADAVHLAEHALRLTPPEREERSERLLTLAGYLETAGERQRVTDLLTPEVDSLPEGGPRVRAWLLLSEGGAIESYDDHERHLERALAETGDDPELRAHVLATKAINTAAEGVERIREAEAWALEALPEPRGAAPDVERLALRGLGWARSLRGRPIDDVCERFLAASEDRFPHHRLARAGRRAAAGRGAARSSRRGRRRRASARSPTSAARRCRTRWLRLHLCELELRVGEWDAAARLLDEWAESGDRQLLITPTYQRCRALLAAGRGLPDEAKRVGDAGARRGRGARVPLAGARGPAGARDRRAARARAGAAAEQLRAVWDHMQREGIDEPGAFPVAPELVEALAELGELDEAQAVTDRLRELAEQQEHPWGLATAKRCGAVIALAVRHLRRGGGRGARRGRRRLRRARPALRRARAACSASAGRSGACGSGAPHATSLEAAVAAFDALGSPGWAERARSELARVGARRPSASGELTATEQRVARAGGGRARQQGDRARALHHGAHGRGAPHARLREARHPLAHPARRAPLRLRDRGRRSGERGDQPRAVEHAERAVGARQVRLHGLDAEEQRLGDRAVALARDREVADLALAGRQRRRALGRRPPRACA